MVLVPTSSPKLRLIGARTITAPGGRPAGWTGSVPVEGPPATRLVAATAASLLHSRPVPGSQPGRGTDGILRFHRRRARSHRVALHRGHRRRDQAARTPADRGRRAEDGGGRGDRRRRHPDAGEHPAAEGPGEQRGRDRVRPTEGRGLRRHGRLGTRIVGPCHLGGRGRRRRRWRPHGCRRGRGGGPGGRRGLGRRRGSGGAPGARDAGPQLRRDEPRPRPLRRIRRQGHHREGAARDRGGSRRPARAQARGAIRPGQSGPHGTAVALEGRRRPRHRPQRRRSGDGGGPDRLRRIRHRDRPWVRQRPAAAPPVGR